MQASSSKGITLAVGALGTKSHYAHIPTAAQCMDVECISARSVRLCKSFNQARSGGGGRAALWKAAACAVFLLALSLPAVALRMVADETGRKVMLPDHVHRIVCLTPSVADTLYSIGAGADIVGITDYTFFPPEVRQKPSIGDILRPSLERIAMLHPDVVIGVAPLNSAETIRGIERMGIPIFLVNTIGLEGLYGSIESIGRAVGRDQGAAAVVAQLRARERKVRSQAANGTRPSVFLTISIDPCISAGHRAFITELLSVAGARSVTDDIAQDWINISIEAILSRKPDFVLLMRDSPFGLKELRDLPGWSSLDSVRMGRVIRIDDRLQYPSPIAFDALEDFARQLRSAEAH
jgi:iron complex transport system substrate-binding protein